MNEWRSNFSSTALAIMNDFFSRNKDINTTDLTASLLQKCTFVYENLDKPVKSEAFRSVFILQLLATVHIHSTIGHANIPALDTEKLASCGITGALSVCAAAVSLLFSETFSIRYTQTELDFRLSAPSSVFVMVPLPQKTFLQRQHNCSSNASR